MRLARGAFIADFGLVFDLSNTKDIIMSQVNFYES